MTEDPRHEVIRRACAAYNRADVEAFLETVVADVDFAVFSTIGAPERGTAAVRDWFARVRETFAELEVLPIRFESQGDWLIVETAYRFVGRGSGVEMTMPLFIACHFEGPRLSVFRVVRDRDEALEVARR